jgi:hypothetical protein
VSVYVHRGEFMRVYVGAYVCIVFLKKINPTYTILHDHPIKNNHFERAQVCHIVAYWRSRMLEHL